MRTSRVAPSPAAAHFATTDGSTTLAQIAVARPDSSDSFARSRSSMKTASPPPPAVGLSPESLMKNGRSRAASAVAIAQSASPAAVLKENAARFAQ